MQPTQEFEDSSQAWNSPPPSSPPHRREATLLPPPLLFPQARPATHIIQAIDELKDLNTLATLLSVPDACDTFWRESHSRREDIRTPARSILARAFSNAACRKRLKLVDRAKRLVCLFVDTS